MDLYYEIYKQLFHLLNDSKRIVQVSMDLVDMRAKQLPNSKKLDYVYHLLKEHNLLEQLTGLEETKNDAKSLEYRQQGNSHFSKYNYMKALNSYNQSVCFAESQENLAIGLANRSAVLFEMRLFRECLESIRLARETGVPDRILGKLNRREEKCQQELEGKSQEEPFVPKVDLPVNEKIPFLAKCLKLRENEEVGRHVITEEDIPAGTVIAMEKPFAKVLRNSEKYLRCCNCLQELPHLLMPCKSCTQTMFCSKECQEEAQGDFHAYECGIIRTLYEVFDHALTIVVRVVIKTFLAFSNHHDTMTKEMEMMDKEKKTVFDFDWRQDLTAIEKYTPIHSMLTNESLRKADDLFKKYTFGCLMYYILREFSPEFRDRFLTDPESENVLKNLIFKHLQTVSINANGLSAVEDCCDPFSDQEYGSALYSFFSLINHSCAPNLTKIQYLKGKVAVFVTLKNIKAGEEVLCNYGYHHSVMIKSQRQKETLRRYHFVCQCIACREDYPVSGRLPMPLAIPDPLSQIFQMPVQSSVCRIIYTRKNAKDFFETLVKFIQYYGHMYPIVQLDNAEDRLIFCLNVIYRNVSLKILHTS